MMWYWRFSLEHGRSRARRIIRETTVRRLKMGFGAAGGRKLVDRTFIATPGGRVGYLFFFFLFFSSFLLLRWCSRFHLQSVRLEF